MILTSTTATYTSEEDDAMQAELTRLRAYVEADCECRECQTKRHCLPGCRYEVDSPDAWERMQAARKAMWGDNEKGE